MTSLAILNQFWGYSQFRAGQELIINAALAGKDVLALLPTGGGKSLCYQVPALILPGITIVISPLISLMQDQVFQLVQRGVSATYLASSLEKTELRERIVNLKNGAYKIVYLSPERLQNSDIQSLCKTLPISLVVIDEAHCVSQWGHSFRPSYRAIAERVRMLRPSTPMMALTATATPKTAQDLIDTLHLHNPVVQSLSFVRDIAIRIWQAQSTLHKDLQLLTIIQNASSKPLIIYASTRKSVERVSLFLHSLEPFIHRTVGYYHAGLDSDVRERTQQQFINNSTSLMVATSAFGMGIDKADVETVIHYQLPGSIEQYYQEIGRAGRGGQSATAHLLFTEHDLSIQSSMARDTSKQQTKHNLQKLRDLTHFCISGSCRMQQLCRYFGEQLANPCGTCDRCQHKSPILDQDSEQWLRGLEQWRKQHAQKEKMHPYQVLTDTQLQLLTLLKPSCPEELKKIATFGDVWIDRWAKKLFTSA